MLSRLTLSNFILIDRLELRPEGRINLLAGETGAGKSIIVDALQAVLGGRVGPEVIRAGCDRAYLEAAFAVSPAGDLAALLEAEEITPAVPGELVLAREVGPRGSRCRIEGRQVTLGVLKQVGELLVDVMGQHEHQLLLRPREHLAVLDRFGGPELLGEAQQHQARFRRVATLTQALADRERAAVERARALDFLRFQQAELEAAGLTDPDEEDRLRAELSRLANADGLRRALREAQDALRGGGGRAGGGADQALERAAAALRQGASLDAGLVPLQTELEGAIAVLQDLATDLRRYADRQDEDPARLAEVEARLGVLASLERKYGHSLADVFAHMARVQAELAAADDDAGSLEAGREEVAAVQAELVESGRRLSELRHEAAARLQALVLAELADLGMAGAAFEVRFEPVEQAGGLPGPQGFETAEFLIAANRGEPLRPLARTASGGELARLMLALKAVLVASDPIGTLVLDEVDTGISGRTAQAVARKIATLGERYQILLITHLPAIAAVAQAHFRVEKRTARSPAGERTTVHVEALSGERRVETLAAMASGSGSAEALAHAAQLLADASGRRPRAAHSKR